MAYFGVKMMYRYEVGGERFYEESVLRVRAASFDEAIGKAQTYADNMIDNEHINPEGLEVRESVCDVMDCFLMQEHDDGIEEIYSGIMKNRSHLTEEAYLNLMFDECSTEELADLRYWQFSD